MIPLLIFLTAILLGAVCLWFAIAKTNNHQEPENPTHERKL